MAFESAPAASWQGHGRAAAASSADAQVDSHCRASPARRCRRSGPASRGGVADAGLGVDVAAEVDHHFVDIDHARALRCRERQPAVVPDAFGEWQGLRNEGVPEQRGVAGHGVLESQRHIAPALRHPALPAEGHARGGSLRIDDCGIAVGEVGLADRRQQGFELARGPHVVLVAGRDEVTAAQGKGPREVGVDAQAPGVPMQLDAVVAARGVLDDLGGAVSGGVVDHHQLQFAMGLREYRGQLGFDIGLAVASAQRDRNERGGHVHGRGAAGVRP
jgi:hypothetical protein